MFYCRSMKEHERANMILCSREASCVRSDLAVTCAWGERIYNDNGSTARFDLSVWAAYGDSKTVDNQFFYCNDDHDIPPIGVTPMCLLKTASLPIDCKAI